MRDVKILFALSAGRCVFPECHRLCIVNATANDPEVVTAKVAHIAAHSDEGPRANSTLTLDERDSYNNWILLCGEDHDVVDHQPNSYGVDELRRWKTEHEQWVRKMYESAMPAVTFAELKIVAHALVNMPQMPSESFALTAPQAKMEKNGLTHQSSFLMTMGIGKSRDVEHFVESMAILDSDFPERLRSGFLAEYNALRGQGYHGDGLFQGLLEVATGVSPEFPIKAAGLATLCYLFEKCEVFEP